MTTTTSSLSDLPSTSDVFYSPFPAPTKEASTKINGVDTTACCMYFSDKIIITISQGGRLGQWIQIPLTSASPTSYDTSIPLPPAGGPGSNAASMILPLQHLTPRTLLGAGGEERERVGHLYASQIGSMILGRNPEERRGILVGLGFAKIGEGRDSGEREAYFDLLELIGAVL
ncbi:hypothetical protein MFRU_036g00730 [Monilinia fructicola]|uniref:Proteasome assembly chaperone 3 n=1 Tax=Monilinia fructicola TaxID=38448 RepID=A0A5M9J865_MONFR|nr:hypothetical protein EYC84_011841 [Monilinia fructicola]KAG4026840.1 hypothetical protein MFRU_036g00730 [Monilinia fructicola]